MKVAAEGGLIYMRPELTDNPAFLRYYEKWRKDPTSVVFAAISEIFRTNGMLDEAIKIAQEGLKHHPDLVSGKLALSKAYLANGEVLLAKRCAESVLEKMPNHEEAIKIIGSNDDTTVEDANEDITEEMPFALIDEEPEVAEEAVNESVSNIEEWHTLTMAEILKKQGHFERARRIYKRILEREPNSKEAIEGLKEV